GPGAHIVGRARAKRRSATCPTQLRLRGARPASAGGGRRPAAQGGSCPAIPEGQSSVSSLLCCCRHYPFRGAQSPVVHPVPRRYSASPGGRASRPVRNQETSSSSVISFAATASMVSTTSASDQDTV